MSAAEGFPVGLGQLMAARAFLRRICRVDYHYTAQSGLVENELEQLVERPLALFGVTTNLATPYSFQFLYDDAPTMFCGVVHNLFGHDVILVLCASGLLVAGTVKKTPLPRPLQIRFTPAPDFFCVGRIEAHVQHLAILRVRQSGDRPNRVTVNSNRACGLAEQRLRTCVVGHAGIPLALALHELDAANESLNRTQPDNRKNGFLEQQRNPNAVAFYLDLPASVTAYRNHNAQNFLALPMALIFGYQTFGHGARNLGVVLGRGFFPMSKHVDNRGAAERIETVEYSRKRIGNLDFDRASHCVYHLAVHVVFCTKFRHPILTAERRDFVPESLTQIAENNECEIIEFGSEADHIHFLLRYPPTVVVN
jgi:Transposase IS200 like